MRTVRESIQIYAYALIFAPLCFGVGMYLYYSDFNLGEPSSVETGGAIGLAANMSMTGLNVFMRIVLSIAPHVLILGGLALPVIAMLYTSQRIDNDRGLLKLRNRIALWSLAAGQTAAMLVVFVYLSENRPF